MTDYVVFWSLKSDPLKSETRTSYEENKRANTLSAGLVENLSFFTPFSSKSMTTLSAVQTASFFPFGAQQMAVTLHKPGLEGCAIDSKNFNCIFQFGIRERPRLFPHKD